MEAFRSKNRSVITYLSNMVIPVTSTFPRALKLSIDDLGVFYLLVGEKLPVGELLFGPKHAEGGWVAVLNRSLHGGAQWTLSGVGSVGGVGGEQKLTAGASCTIGGQQYTVRQPDPASPLLWLQPGGADLPGILFLAPGELDGFSVGPPGSAWVLEGIQHATAVSALPEGLRIACKGGVRYSKGDGEFDGARPFQEAKWTQSGQQMFWNSARAGSGAPFFITLEPLISPVG